MRIEQVKSSSTELYLALVTLILALCARQLSLGESQVIASSSTSRPTKNASEVLRNPYLKATSKRAKTKGEHCTYERGQWQQCEADGFQKRVLKLRAGSEPSCDSERTIRRECKQGCKYARGEWSPYCSADGRRVRIDKLVSVAGTDKLNDLEQACGTERRVIKDCKRACHYVKSAWSDCKDGFKTRKFTLVALPSPLGSGKAQSAPMLSACAPERLIKRPCGHSGSVRNQMSGNKAVRKAQARQQSKSKLRTSSTTASTKVAAAPATTAATTTATTVVVAAAAATTTTTTTTTTSASTITPTTSLPRPASPQILGLMEGALPG